MQKSEHMFKSSDKEGFVIFTEGYKEGETGKQNKIHHYTHSHDV